MDRLEITPPTKEKLATAQWVFERQLAWIAAADVKVGVVVSVDLALLGGLAAAFSVAAHKTLAGEVFATLAGIGLVIAVICAALATFPRLNGPKQSLLFFGRIADGNADEYVDALLTASEADLIGDWARQIHTNARIANEKHNCVRHAMIWSFGSVIPWLIALCYFVKP
ncbi:Pycsar system effector family protein [Burkholderia pseudomallei]|uniref:Pycsar system effector family protein n=1 Tax=Burkholderia pseudomallei TaxID=28450 RepID=UPI00061C31FD|nr:Pycsar system effector family protein [Burkholderia pseudomallei]CAJ3147465.1 Uncharacterised protein [Burkholderia pseudomallei]CAK0226199.1 Uncharacterised protein [Burkholderia pseudomallei]CAK1291692.1 Uncharacterised protein [Burkholderia pseudomallei]VCM82376.1 Uncharacterised protein [Burkholderia pseudomallei]